MEKDVYAIYTDGSNDEDIKVGWGYLVLKNDEIIFEDFGLSPSKFNSSRNINGEVHAVIEALTWCMENEILEINMYNDYTGIQKWAEGEWSANKPLTIHFKNFMKSNHVKVNWFHVKGHSGNVWNERADKLAGMGRGKYETKK